MSSGGEADSLPLAATKVAPWHVAMFGIVQALANAPTVRHIGPLSLFLL
jgi:hypothetical protein